MTKEAVMFSSSVIISTLLFGLGTTPALFIFGFIWLLWGEP